MKKLFVSCIAALAMLASVTACTNSSQVDNRAVAVVAQDVAIIANGLKGALPALAVAAKIPAENMASINQAITSLETLSSVVASAASTTQALPAIQQVETDVNAIVAALVGIPGLPTNVTLALAAAQVLLPVIETSVGMIVPPPAPTAHAYALSPEDARAILIGQSRASKS